MTHELTALNVCQSSWIREHIQGGSESSPVPGQENQSPPCPLWALLTNGSQTSMQKKTPT